MKAAVIGLGVEGKKASKVLINHGWDVYATDLKNDIDVKDLEMVINDVNILNDKNNTSINNELSMDLGYNDKNKIDSCDAIVLSPSLWNSNLAKEVKLSSKLLSDLLTMHKDIFTIGITGTNGKTTTSTMLKDILERAGKKVLIGGNAGGGFQGYCEVFLEAEKNSYDVIIVEVCDMTLDFCKYSFDFNLVALTNIGNDHLNVHGSVAKYGSSLVNFFKDQNIVINESEELASKFEKVSNNTITYNSYNYDLNIVGKFNRLNAGLAYSIAKYLNINENIIKDSLKNFETVEGRLKIFKLNNLEIYIGKSDNSDAIKPILDEEKFNIVFIGTPRYSEKHRFDILNEVAKSSPQRIVLFPGLEDTVDTGVKRLEEINYNGKIEVANNIDEIIGFLAEYSDEKILIGGNGQEVIIEIQKILELLTETCN